MLNGNLYRCLHVSWVAAIVALACVSPAAHAAKIVAAEDDWTLGDPGFDSPSDPGVFAANVAAWFTGGSSGNFLAWSGHFGYNGALLAAAMTGAGHSWTVMSPSGTLTLATMQTYDAVFLGADQTAGLSASTLIDYVNAGGNIYVNAGGGDTTIWNQFLLPFGLQFGPNYNPLIGHQPITSTHPIMAGVDHLFDFNGNYVLDLEPDNPANQIVATVGADGIYGVYDSALAYSPADFNLDGYVDGADFSFFLGQWGIPGGPPYSDADFNTDGTVDGADFSFFLGQWNPDSPPAEAFIPEPTSALALFTFAAFGLASHRKRFTDQPISKSRRGDNRLTDSPINQFAPPRLAPP